MSAVETGQMTAAATSVLSQQKTSVLSQQQILCLRNSAGARHIEIAISRQPYGNSSNRWHPQVQNRGAVLMGIVPWRVVEKQKMANLGAPSLGLVRKSWTSMESVLVPVWKSYCLASHSEKWVVWPTEVIGVTTRREGGGQQK